MSTRPTADNFDLLVIGAGPGGLAAAVTAAEAGMRVCLLDDNPAPGGQIWRKSILPGKANPTAHRWLHRLQQARVEVRTGWRAMAESANTPFTPRALRVEKDGVCADIQYAALILAPGARELFLPFPGWTLPGVFGAGGLQAFYKSGLEVTGKRIVVAGTGPLLLAVAASLRKAGAKIAAIVEQAPLARLAGFGLSLASSHPGKLIEGATYVLATSGVPFLTGSWITAASGDTQLQSVTVTDGAKTANIPADYLAIGYHLIPNTELPQLLGCRIDSGFVHVNAFQQTSVPGIYCVGEPTGIGGVDKAQLEGRIAALAIAGRTAQARELHPARDRQRLFAQRLAHTFALRPELRTLAAPDTLVCRCEDVPHSALAACHSWREAKLHTRCGMGPCQGRICSPATQFLFNWATPTPRPPIYPVPLQTLVSTLSTENDPPKPVLHP